MAKSWRDFRASEAAFDGCDNSDVSDVSPSNGADQRPNVRNVTNVTALPSDIQDGLKRLSDMAAPRLRHPERWQAAVADANCLAAEGWASQALGLGWTKLDLFGAVPAAGGDPDADGLAVKLTGRRVLAVCGTFATAADEQGRRTYLHRGNTEGAVLLWALGRGR